MPALEATSGRPADDCAICSWVIDEVIVVEGFLERSSARRGLSKWKEIGFGGEENCSPTGGHCGV